MPRPRRFAIDSVDNVRDIWLALRTARLLALLERREIITPDSYKAFEDVEQDATLGLLIGIKQISDEFPALFWRGPLVLEAEYGDDEDIVAHHVEGEGKVVLNLNSELLSQQSNMRVDTRRLRTKEAARHELAHFGVDQLNTYGWRRFAKHWERRTKIKFPNESPKAAKWVTRRLGANAASDVEEMVAEAIALPESSSALARNIRRGFAEFFGPNASAKAYEKYTRAVRPLQPHPVRVSDDEFSGSMEFHLNSAIYMSEYDCSYVTLTNGQMYRVGRGGVIDISASTNAVGIVRITEATVARAVVGHPLEEPDPSAPRMLDASPISSIITVSRDGGDMESGTPRDKVVRDAELKLYLAEARTGTSSAETTGDFLVRVDKPANQTSTQLYAENPWLMNIVAYRHDGSAVGLGRDEEDIVDDDQNPDYTSTFYAETLDSGDFESIELWESPPLSGADLFGLADAYNVVAGGAALEEIDEELALDRSMSFDV